MDGISFASFIGVIRASVLPTSAGGNNSWHTMHSRELLLTFSGMHDKNKIARWWRY
jgi:hypothetical protein